MPMRDFKSALLRMGDEAFFELVRNYLGRIKTPFNKHNLIDRLVKFLRQSDVQARIVELITDNDARLLTAIWILGEPRLDDIHASFGGGSYLDLHQQLLNLEDRLLVYRDEDRIGINPLLVDALGDQILRPGRVFAFRRETDGSAETPWLTDSALVAAFALVAENGELFKADGSLRKRTSTDLKDRAAILAEPVSTEGQVVPRLRIVVDALVSAGAVRDGDGLQNDPDGWAALSNLGTERRAATLVAALATDGRHGYETLAAGVEHLTEAIGPGLLVEERAVERLLLILDPHQSGDTLRRCREALGLFGFLQPAGDGFVRAAFRPESHSDRAENPVVIQPNFDVTVPSSTPFREALALAGVARLTRHDTYSHFELTKERFAAALQTGQPVDDVIAELTALTADRLPSNITSSLRGWAAEFESVQLLEGVVLTVEEARRFSVEHSQTIQALMRKELAPGVYLFAKQDIPELREALQDAGVELVPEIMSPSAPPRAASAIVPAPVNPERGIVFARIFSTATEDEAAPDDRPAEDPSWVAELYDKVKTIGSDQQEAMRARIANRLVVTPDQIADGTMKIEKTEARGLDYVGKVRIIEQAVRTGTSLLEVIERDDDGSPIKRLLEPIELEKGGNDLLLVAEQLPDREPVRVRVRKLGLVRRLRSGLVRRRPIRR